jgi:hypothetical protein
MTTSTTAAKPTTRRAPYPAAWRGHWFDAGRPSSAAVGEATRLLLETVARGQKREETANAA